MFLLTSSLSFNLPPFFLATFLRQLDHKYFETLNPSFLEASRLKFAYLKHLINLYRSLGFAELFKKLKFFNAL
jgi:hypothetical protein